MFVTVGFSQNQYTGTFTGTFTGNGIGNFTQATNASAAPVPFVIWHTNSSASFTIGTNTSVISFPGSPTLGFNEIQALWLTNTFLIFKADPGTWPQPTATLTISNSGEYDFSGILLDFTIVTDSFTLTQMTNALGRPPDAAALLDVAYGTQQLTGDEPTNVYDTTIKNLYLKTATNMFCVGVMVDGGNHVRVENVAVGGPEFMPPNGPYNRWVPSSSSITVGSKVIGFIVGDNQQKFVDCGAYGTADGIAPIGNSQVEIDNFTAQLQGKFSTAYPNTSEYSIGAGILIPTFSTEASVSVKTLLTYKTFMPIYVGGNHPLNVYDWLSQDTPAYKVALLYDTTANRWPPVSIIGTASGSQVLSWTYTNSNGTFTHAGTGPSPVAQIVLNGTNAGFMVWNGYQKGLSVDSAGNIADTWGLFPPSTNILTLNGSGSALTNLNLILGQTTIGGSTNGSPAVANLTVDADGKIGTNTPSTTSGCEYSCFLCGEHLST